MDWQKRTKQSDSVLTVRLRVVQINRVALTVDRLTQWRCNAQAVCGFAAEALGIRNAVKQTDETGL